MKSLFRRIGGRLGARERPVRAVEAYDLWAATYDAQPDNVVFALESPLFTELLARVSVEGRTVIDVGCGTGRHWPEILSRNPASMIGVDPSSRMLERLTAHYPRARVVCSEGDRLAEIADASCDLVLSTLALAHCPSPASAIREWSRVLRRGGAIAITDFHPEAIRAGMKRTFIRDGRTIEIEHYATDIAELHRIASGYGLAAVFSSERVIDESARPLFERAQYLAAYERNYGRPVVFGAHFIKP